MDAYLKRGGEDQMRLILALAALVIFACPTIAKDQIFRIGPEMEKKLHPEETACAEILSFIEKDKQVNRCRYGTEGKKVLGSYLSKPELVFKSPYRELDPGSKVEFAYKLGRWYEMNGGGFEKPGAEMPYLKLEEFARNYWQGNKTYAKVSLVPKDWFLHESIIDGMTIWLYSQQETKHYGPRGQEFIESYLKKIKERKPTSK